MTQEMERKAIVKDLEKTFENKTEFTSIVKLQFNPEDIV